jgi:adapter protein MecA 1/2
MKIEKLTEDKIRIILSIEDLEKKDLTLKDFITNEKQFQEFFIEMLDRAEKELGFITKDCKLLIESFSSPDDVFVFTITKFSKTSGNNIHNKKRLVCARKKANPIVTQNKIYNFNNFEEFCAFCEAVNNSKIMNSNKKLAKSIILYSYKNTYYLVLSNINQKNSNFSCLHSYISEFSTCINYTKSFEGKLLEYGKPIIKNNAILTGIKFFVK